MWSSGATCLPTVCLLMNINNRGRHEYSGADPGFQVRGGGPLKKLRRAEGGTKIVGVFRVKNLDFTPKKSYFFQF